MKRIFDFILALSGLVISMPLWLIFGLAIWLEDRVPIFYLQERVGKDSKIFKSIKFRSMVSDAECGLGPVQAGEKDPRVTKVGNYMRRSALDELPQLINIIKGDMSFVGPRALRPVEIDTEDDKLRGVWEFKGFKERSIARPGLTGIAQVFAPRNISRSEKFKYDIWYIKNQSLLLDIYIIVLSFIITFLGKWETRNDKFGFLARGLKERLKSQIGY